MINRTKHNASKFKGQSLIEMAIMLPLLLMLVITTIELGRLFYTQIVITNAAREGAYYLSTHISDYDIGSLGTLDAAQREASNSGVQDITINVTPVNCCEIGNYSVQVTVDTTVNDLLIVGVLNVFSVSVRSYDSFPLSSTVEMMVQP